MTVSQKGIDLIKSQEGCVLHPYLDQAHIPTIGWGNTRYFNGVRVTMQDAPITQEIADALLLSTIKGVAHEVDGMITDAINQNQADALIDFAYNVGTPALQGSTLRKRVNANPLDPAIRDAFMMWDKITIDGQHMLCEDLVKRRAKEADLYFLTTYQ
jgi:lysozyme